MKPWNCCAAENSAKGELEMSTESAQIDDRRHLLEMVAAGKMSVADAAEQIAALGATDDTPPKPEGMAEEPPAAKASQEWVEESKPGSDIGQKARWLRIQVNDMASGKSKVRVNLPLSFLNIGLKIGGRFAPELQQLSLKELTDELSGVEKGILVDVADEEGGEHVQIFVD
jgi:hypothetical protein